MISLEKSKGAYFMKLKFYICRTCGNIMAAVSESGVPVMCCGKPMSLMEPNSVDAALEKHVPQYRIDGSRVHVTVGEVDHPMNEDHSIRWIAIQTTGGNQRKCLKAGDEPRACFSLCPGDELIAVYAYCNLHGLWVAQSDL